MHEPVRVNAIWALNKTHKCWKNYIFIKLKLQANCTNRLGIHIYNCQGFVTTIKFLVTPSTSRQFTSISWIAMYLANQIVFFCSYNCMELHIFTQNNKEITPLLANQSQVIFSCIWLQLDFEFSLCRAHNEIFFAFYSRNCTIGIKHMKVCTKRRLNKLTASNKQVHGKS